MSVSTTKKAHTRAKASTLLRFGEVLRCAGWQYRGRDECYTLHRRKDGTVTRHDFKHLTDLLDDLEVECDGDWKEVTYNEATPK